MKSYKFGSLDFISKAFFIFTLGYLAKKIGPNLYGAWSLLMGFQLLIANLTSLGFSTSMQRLLPSLSIEKQNYYIVSSLAINLLLNIVAFFVICIFGFIIMDIYKLSQDTEILIYLISFISFVTCLETTLDASLKIREDVKKYVFFVGYRTLCELMCLIYFFKIYQDSFQVNILVRYVIALVSLKIIGYFFILLSFKKIKCEWHNMSEYIRYGLPTVFASVILWGVGNLDKLVLTQYLSPYDLGNYCFGASLATYITLIGPFIVPLLLTRLSLLYDTKAVLAEQNIWNYLNKNTTCLIVCIGGLWTFVSLFSEELILLTAGENYRNALTPFFFLSLYYGIDQIFGLWAYIYYLKKRVYLLTILRLSYFFLFLFSLFVSSRILEGKYLIHTIIVMGIFYNSVLYGVSQILFPIKMSKWNFILVSLFFIISIYFHLFLVKIGVFEKFSILFIFALCCLSILYKEHRAAEALFSNLKSHTLSPAQG
jgi:O-antigen/teichoic acid export membrane protein